MIESFYFLFPIQTDNSRADSSVGLGQSSVIEHMLMVEIFAPIASPPPLLQGTDVSKMMGGRFTKHAYG